MIKNEITQKSFFDSERVRKVLLENEWWFSVVDVIDLFIDDENPQDYWSKMKKGKGGKLATICRQLKLTAPDGKKYQTDCANTEGIFRIIQSIPSPKAEPFKQWLARVGKERIDEIANPELGMQRTKSLYEKKGYPKEWIEKRLRGVAVREKLTDEWKNRGAQKSIDFALLTNDIMQGAFGVGVNAHKELKGLEKENLRDHMTDLELIITMLGEATTTQITQQKDSKGIKNLRHDAKTGGAVAGRTRKDIENQLGTKIVSRNNFLPNKKKLIKDNESI